jgi:hypothetical protein
MPVRAKNRGELNDLNRLGIESNPAGGAPPKGEVMVLFDDLHLCGDAGRRAVDKWVVKDYGLGHKGELIPVAIAYSAGAEDRYKADIEYIQGFIEQWPRIFRTIDLKPFASPLEDEVPYQQFLMGQSPMLVLKDVSEDRRVGFYGALHDSALGIPSRFASSAENIELRVTVAAYRRINLLETADDEKMIAEERTNGR